MNTGTQYCFLSVRIVDGEEMLSFMWGNDRQFIHSLYVELETIHDTPAAGWSFHLAIWECTWEGIRLMEETGAGIHPERIESLHEEIRIWHAQDNNHHRQANSCPGPTGGISIQNH